MKHALYAGSFDPITRGHLDIISKARKTFDRVTIGKGINPSKKPYFDVNRALYLIAYSLREGLGIEFETKITKQPCMTGASQTSRLPDGKGVIVRDSLEIAKQNNYQIIHYGTGSAHDPQPGWFDAKYISFTSLDGSVHVGFYDDTIPAYARRIGATHLVRGLRQVSDFDDEFKLHGIMQRAAPDLTPVHFICETQFLHVSSSTAREMAKLEMDVDWLVTPVVEAALKGQI